MFTVEVRIPWRLGSDISKLTDMFKQVTFPWAETRAATCTSRLETLLSICTTR